MALVASLTLPGLYAPIGNAQAVVPDPTITSSPSSPGNDATPAWEFDAGGYAAECQLEHQDTTTTVVDPWTSCTSPKSYDLAALNGNAEGTYVFSVRAHDGAGNYSNAVSSSYEYDTTPPGAPTITIPPSSPGNDTTPSWEFTGEAGATFTCWVTRGDGSMAVGQVSCTSPFTADLSGEADGDYTFHVIQTDEAGNVGTAEATDVYTLDTTPPAETPTIDASPASPGNDPDPEWSFSSTGTDPFQCRLTDGAGADVFAWGSCASPHSYSLSGQADGDYTFHVRHIDAAGNGGPAATSTYTFDATAPPAPTIDQTPSSPGNDTSPEWQFSGASGATFECRVSDSLGGDVVAWTACTSPFSADLSAEADGDYTFHVVQTDTAGNTSPAATDTYTLDRTEPGAPTITDWPASPGNDTSPSWEFTGESGATFECRVSDAGGIDVVAWTSCTSPFSTDLSAEPDGTYTFHVRQIDAAGNPGTEEDTHSYVLDTTAPAAPTITSSPSSPGNNTLPAWGFSGESGGSFECRVIGPDGIVRDWGTCTSPFAVDLSGGSDGDYTFSVRQTDDAGNTGPTASDVYTLDTTPPGAPTITDEPDSPGNDLTPTWSFTGESGATFRCRLTDGSGNEVFGWGGCSSPHTVDLSGQSDGDYTLHVRQVDEAGNEGSDTATSTYTLDTTPPPPPTITSEPVSPDNTRTPSWTFTGESGATFECRMTDSSGSEVAPWAGCVSPYSADLTGQPDGDYTFHVRQTDVAGNQGSSATSTYVLDTTAPAAPTITSEPASPGNDPTPEWTFTGESGATFACQVLNNDTGAVVAPWGACTSPYSVSLANQPDGAYMFYVRQTDEAGNTGPSATSKYQYDTKGPDAPVITEEPPSPGTDPTPTWQFEGEGGGTFTCWVTDGSGTVIVGPVTCTSPYTVDLTSRPDDAYTFRVQETDKAGNNGLATAESMYVLDRTPPDAPTITASPDSPGNDTTPSWSFSGETGTTFECRMTDSSGSEVAPWAGCVSPYSADLTGQPDGDYTFHVRQTDEAGNTGPAATDLYTLDTTPPGIPTITSTPPSPGNDRYPQWSFTGESGATFECRVTSGSGEVQGWAGCASPFTADLSGQPDGSYAFHVRQTDEAGNTGLGTTDVYTLDTTAADAPTITERPSSPSNDTSPSWEFTGEAGATFECRVTDAAGSDVVAWTGCTSPVAVDLSGEPDGDYTFHVRQTDEAGNTSDASTDTYTLDTTPPSMPSFDVTPSSPSNDTSPTWEFSGEAGATFECRMTDAFGEVFAWTSCASPFSPDLSDEPDGDYTLHVRQTDEAGNTGLAATDVYTLDTTAPDAPAASSPPSPSNDTSPSWEFAGESGATFECRVSDAGGADVVSWTSCTSPFTADLSEQPDGDYRFHVRQTDEAGNTGPETVRGYTLDTAPADAPTMTDGPSSPSNDTSPSWEFSGEAEATFECRVTAADGSDVVAWTDCTSPVAVDLSDEPDGDYTFHVRQVDEAGNTSDASTDTYTLDTTPPGAPTIDVTPPSPSNDTSPTWEFSGEAEATFECRVTAAVGEVFAWAPCQSPFSPDLSGKADGEYTLHVRQIDEAGNSGPATTSKYTLDVTPPPAPTITSSSPSPSPDVTPEWRFSGEDGGSFACRVIDAGGSDVVPWTSCTSPFTADLTGRGDGTYTFHVRQTDDVGNAGPAATSAYTVDTTPPVAPTITAAPDSPGNDRSPTWSVSGESDGQLECRLTRGVEVISDWAACGPSVTYDLSGEPDATYTLTARDVDAAGNGGPTVTSSYILDTTPPPAPTITRAPESPSTGTSPLWSFSGEDGGSFECRVTDASGFDVVPWSDCTSPFTVDLSGRPDGTFTFQVRQTDVAGNTGPATTSSYRLDIAPPPAPTITRAPPSPGNDTTPSWSFSGESGGSFECRVAGGAGSDVVGWTSCSSAFTADLSGRSDGTYIFRVRQTDDVGNTGPAATSRYTLDTTPPPAPTITRSPRSPGDDTTPSWSFSGERGATFECRLTRGAEVVSNWAPCDASVTYDLSGDPDAAYTLFVRAIDAAGNTGPAATSRYTLRTRTPEAPASEPTTTPPAGQSPPPAPPPQTPPEQAPEPEPETEPEPEPTVEPTTAPTPEADDEPDEGVVAAGPPAGGGGGDPVPVTGLTGENLMAFGATVVGNSPFPLLLVLLVVAFLVVQHHIDRNDPKLAEAPVYADPDLPFTPRPTDPRTIP